MASRSPSRLIAAPVLVFMLRMIDLSEALDGRCRVRMNLEELIRAREREHRLDAAPQAGELERRTGGGGLPVQIHEAADRGAVEVVNAGEIDHDFACASGDLTCHHRRELRQRRVHEPRGPRVYDDDIARLFARHVHSYSPFSFARSASICFASSPRPRLMRDLTVPSATPSCSAIS